MNERATLYAKLFGLHERLLAGDPTLLGDIATLARDHLVAHLGAKLRGVDEHVVQEAANDALLEYGKFPGQTNATSGAGVMGFLVLRGESRAKNALKRERRRQVVEGSFALGLRPGGADNPVELLPAHREHDTKPLPDPSPDPLDDLDRRDRTSDVLDGATNAMDRELIQLMLDGERSTSEFVRVLGIGNKSLPDQRRIVKQHKDRLKVALQRRQERKGQSPRKRGRPPRNRPAAGEGT